MNIKKAVAGISSLAMLASSVPALNNQGISAKAETSKYNYAEALQKSMFFYEAQQAGELPDWNEVSWRADSMLKEDGTSSDVVPGGWFDAGDHLKFSLTNAYTASVLSWGLMQYGDAVKKAGLYDTYLKNLKWGLDFVQACDLGDSVIGTIGDDAFDHVWYGSPEVYMRKYNLKQGTEDRPYDTITCVTTVAEMSAALAGGYIVFKDTDPETAKGYLEHAESLFKLANDTWAEKGDEANDDMGTQQKYYNTKNNSGTDNFIDELFYAANWMYMATGDQKYLDKCESDYIPLFPKESQSTDKKFTWGFCWDDTTQGAALLYAINTGKQEWIDHVSHHLDFWMGGYNGKSIGQVTPDGMPILNQWGSLRYAENAAWLAKVASDTIFKDDAQLSEKYNTWAKKMMDYAFGDNDLGMSYVVGMGDKNPVNIHHRGASGIHDDHWNELGTEEPAVDDGWQREYAHVLYGALEGGPNADGSFDDNNGSYTNTEVAIDYNAGFTACLCAMIDDYGGEPLADFPQAETPKWAEWEIGATLNGKGDSYSEIKTWTMNHTAWPARVAENISFNYYFDVSEVLEAGLSVDDISVKIGSQQYQEGQQGYATISGPYKYEGDPSGNTYYAKIQFEDGRAIMPTGQSEHRDEVQFRISIPDAVNGQSTKGAWDPTNDWSYSGIEDAPNELKLKSALNDHITMYVDDVLVWGTEPDGTTPSVTDPTTKPTSPSSSSDDDILWGDANTDGAVDIADAVCVASYVGDSKNNGLSAKGLANADVQSNGNGVNASDALAIQQFLAGTVKSLPID
ncbi:MAG TPA: glycoside hydrolase [Ruminococcus sp.]|nr:glycoside hydrolase [Ruminococcus sp.]